MARTLIAGLKDAGAKITIYNRTVARAEKLAGEFDCEFASLDELVNVRASLVVNCTSVGMYPNVNATPLPKECLKEDMVVFDSIYVWCPHNHSDCFDWSFKSFQFFHERFKR